MVDLDPQRSGRRAWRFVGLAALVGSGLALGLGLRGAEAPDQPEVRTVFVPTPPPPVTLVDSLRSGQTLGQMFSAYGLSGMEVVRLVQAIREYHNPRRLQVGTEVQLAMRPAETPLRISLRLDPDRTLHLTPTAAGAEWRARLDSVSVVTDTIVVGALVETNLYNASLAGDVDRLAPGERFEIVYRLSQIFAWQIDFWRDIRAGDTYRVAVERQVRPDGTVRSARILAAEYVNAGRPLRAIPFEPADAERLEYYDEEGEALRSQFLRAPLEFIRVTSGFSMRRYHPILKRNRPHLGTDYGARAGTPVRATGAGTVSRAGWWGGYGRVIELRHANSLRTRYAHLSGIARGITPGARVEQGQVIGYVGATGLATAPHLHYEFLRGGQQVNPARLDLPRAEPVPERHMESFMAERDAALVLLARLPGSPEQLAAAARAQAATTDD